MAFKFMFENIFNIYSLQCMDQSFFVCTRKTTYKHPNAYNLIHVYVCGMCNTVQTNMVLWLKIDVCCFEHSKWRLLLSSYHPKVSTFISIDFVNNEVNELLLRKALMKIAMVWELNSLLKNWSGIFFSVFILNLKQIP